MHFYPVNLLFVLEMRTSLSTQEKGTRQFVECKLIGRQLIKDYSSNTILSQAITAVDCYYINRDVSLMRLFIAWLVFFVHRINRFKIWEKLNQTLASDEKGVSTEEPGLDTNNSSTYYVSTVENWLTFQITLSNQEWEYIYSTSDHFRGDRYVKSIYKIL